MDTMQTNETWGWKGTIRITITYQDGTQEIEEFPNLIVNSGLNHLRNLLEGTITDGQIKYVAFGTSSTAPASSDTTLGTEVFRKAVTARIEGAAGVLTTRCYLAAGDLAGTTIQEIGWFAGVNATSTANSGTMIARVLYLHAKTNVESIQVDRADTIG